MLSSRLATVGPLARSVQDELGMFPGQGSQRAGMAAHLLDRYEEFAKPIFALADTVAEFSLTELCVSGAKKELTRTEVTQLAVMATSLATWEVLSASGYQPTAVAGHSLGEFAALVAAGVLAPEDAFSLVRRRGELMAQVADQTSGAMLAVVGLHPETVEKLCASMTVAGVAEVSNYNDEQQTVVSGHREALDDVAAAAKDAGAERCLNLDVGAPFHCSLMGDIEREFAAELDRHDFFDPERPVISSVTGTPLAGSSDAKSLLRQQLSGPVRWVDVLRRARKEGISQFTEIGPGRVLTGFVKNSFPGYAVYSTGDARRIDTVIRNISTTER